MSKVRGIKRAGSEVLTSYGSAIRKLAGNWPTVLWLLFLFGGWLGTLALFVTTREATIGQVILGLVVSPLLAVGLFFLLQAIGLSATRVGVGVGYKWKRALPEAGKIALVTLPLVGGAVGMVLAIEWLGEWALERATVSEGPLRRWVLGGWDWSQTFLLFFFFPLWSLHWWLAVVRRGVAGSVLVLGRVLLEAFAPGSIVIYLLTTGVFGGAAWWLLFARPEMADPWWELALFGGRVTAALLVIFLGWLLLLAVMGEWTASRELSSLDREADLARSRSGWN
ncbi:MAG: hypothetical protein ACOYNR_09900 [Blastocatellia bacterium]|jgi:hypothetical protein